jgi:hypothetical protein
MGTLIKLVIAALILYAAAQAGTTAFAHYQFVDAAHEAMVFAPNASDRQLVQAVARIARAHNVPITEEDISIRHDGPDIIIEFSYGTDVNLVPTFYTKHWVFTPSISARSLRLIPSPTP